jgi:hypothetical protein
MNLSTIVTFASPGDAPGFNCSRQAERLVDGAVVSYQWSVEK